MNAHVRPIDISPADGALSDLENPLARILDLAEAASAVVQRDLGTAQPAGTLETLMQLIIEEAQKAETRRVEGWCIGARAGRAQECR